MYRCERHTFVEEQSVHRFEDRPQGKARQTGNSCAPAVRIVGRYLRKHPDCQQAGIAQNGYPAQVSLGASLHGGGAGVEQVVGDIENVAQRANARGFLRSAA